MLMQLPNADRVVLQQGVCRLVYADPARAVAEAHVALTARGLIWIAGYESRPGGALPTWIAPEPVCPSLG